MKYINFKRFKFSTIFKNINFKRYERILTHVVEFVFFIIEYVFSRIYKSFNFIRLHLLKTYDNINFKKYNFSRIFKFVDLRRLDFKKFYKYLYFIRIDFKRVYKYFNIRRFDFTKFSKYLNPKTYNISRIKKTNLINPKFFYIHLPVTILFFGFLYLFIPTFYNYDKFDIENLVCKKQNINCEIRGKVNYNFYPTPRIKIKDFVINDFVEKKKVLIKVENAEVELSIRNLLVKSKHQFKKIKLNNYEIDINLKNFKKYKDFFVKKINYIPVNLSKGKIIFSDGNNYVATINEVNLNLITEEDFVEAVLKGKFLNDNIKISLNSKKKDNEALTNIMLKMSNLNLLAKIDFFDPKKNKNTTSGNILIKKDKNRFTAIFDYKDNELKINKSNLRNIFMDGKLEGKINFLPYFDYNLDLSLNSINFTRLYNYFLSLDKKEKKKLFTVNNKLNGMLNLSADKLYTKHNLVKSFESRIKFYNGNISIEQFLLSLGKLGAADILGTINKDKKFTNFNFESNIFVDNQKKFLSKFGIYNKKNVPTNLFISGNFDLENTKASFYEISDDKKFNNEDVNYIEKEFNDLMLEDGYTYLFHFSKFKEFIKLITSENN